ncbi:MAG TPA: GNAT family N-acetyltransferase, partial [Acidimicrobiales bacterium]|nr:GNAT family N-acetyltransferase [Acidimicrobiales bacterium]
GWLKRVAVAPHRRRAGLGTALVAEAERRFLGAGISKLRLSVMADNRAALAFWSRLGYVDSPDVRYHQKELDRADPRLGSMRPWPTEWPADWADRTAGTTCPMCESLGGPHPSSVLVAEGAVSDIRLDRQSRFAGYCTVVWNRGHAVDPADLEAAEAGRYWADVTRVGRALQLAFEPLKLNYLTLGNTVPHLHTHVVPRYRDDPAAGGPIPWELVRAERPADPQVLESQAARIRSALTAAG